MDLKKVDIPYRNEKGVVLLTIMLMMVLVALIIMMALNISQIESTLASTNRRTTQGIFAAGGGAEIAFPVVQDTLAANGLPTGYPATVAVDTATAGGDVNLADFVEEVASGGGTLADDTAAATPDITVTAMNGQTVLIDVDYEGPATLPGSELEEFGIRYHRKTGGTGCTTGTLYYIDVLSNGPLNSRSNVGSAYYDCT